MSTYYIERNIAIGCTYADMSGLTESDIKSLDSFEEFLITHYGHALFTISNDEIDFRRCDCTGLMSDCIEISINEVTK